MTDRYEDHWTGDEAAAAAEAYRLGADEYDGPEVDPTAFDEIEEEEPDDE